MYFFLLYWPSCHVGRGKQLCISFFYIGQAVMLAEVIMYFFLLYWPSCHVGGGKPLCISFFYIGQAVMLAEVNNYVFLSSILAKLSCWQR